MTKNGAQDWISREPKSATWTIGLVIITLGRYWLRFGEIWSQIGIPRLSKRLPTSINLEVPLMNRILNIYSDDSLLTYADVIDFQF